MLKPKQRTAGMLVSLAAVLLLPSASWAFNLKCPWGTCPPKKEEVFDDVTKLMVWNVAHNPSLMNLEYLQYFIGKPENEALETGANRHYIWYDKNRQPTYELIQQEIAPGQVTDSSLVVPLKGKGVTFTALEALYGNNSRKFFDYEGHPNELFSFAPDTTVAFAAPQNSFRVERAKIVYRGAPLPPPSADDMAMAESMMLAKARTAALQRDKKKPETPHDEALPLLFERVKSQPYSAEAHLHLAQALQKHSLVYQAIGEYKLALSLSGNDPDVRMASVNALRDMDLLPPETPQGPRQFEFVNKGQRIRVAGYEKSDRDDKSDSDKSDKTN